MSGQLDRTLGRPSSLGVKNHKHVFNHTSEDATTYKINRCSLYLLIIRNNLYEAFTLFDYADASLLNGNRSSTIVAPQALFMLNSELVLNAAEQMATSILTDSQLNQENRITNIYRLVYSRPASQREIIRAKNICKTTTRPSSMRTPIHSRPHLPCGNRSVMCWWLPMNLFTSANHAKTCQIITICTDAGRTARRMVQH